MQDNKGLNGQWFSPEELTKYVCRTAITLYKKHLGRDPINIIDPSCGDGAFLKELHKEYPELNICGLEIDEDVASQCIDYNVKCVDTLNITNLSSVFGCDFDFIIGNPPYRSRQSNYAQDQANMQYAHIDKRIKQTYVKDSTAQKTSQYDMYKRFIRWASDIIKYKEGNKDQKGGMIAFITNNAYLNSKQDDGFRYHVSQEFDYAYFIDLKGNSRLNGEESKKQGENVFNIRVGVGIMFLIKNGDNKECDIKYKEVPDYYTKDQKFDFLHNLTSSCEGFSKIYPNAKNQWLGLVDNDWDTLPKLIDKAVKNGKAGDAIFKIYSLGVATSRDKWVYDFNECNLEKKVKAFIAEYEKTRVGMHTVPLEKPLVSQKIKWQDLLERDLHKNIEYKYNNKYIVNCLYRPFIQKKLYFSQDGMIERRYSLNKIFNPYISVEQDSYSFSTIATNIVPSFDLLKHTMYVPMYELIKKNSKTFNNNPAKEFKKNLNIKDSCIKYTRELKRDLEKNKRYIYNSQNIKDSLYRPFIKKKLYFSQDGMVESKYSTPNIYNETICNKLLTIDRTGISRPLVCSYIPDLHLVNDGFNIPLYRQSIVLSGCSTRLPFSSVATTKATDTMFFTLDAGFNVPLYDTDKQIEFNNKTIQPNITNYGVEIFSSKYGKDTTIQDVFYYCYAIMNSKYYKTKYKGNLRVDLPRIPILDNNQFISLARLGKQLCDLHINYESTEHYQDLQLVSLTDKPQTQDIKKIKKEIKLKVDKENGRITLDTYLAIDGIPKEVYEYQIGGKSPIEWVCNCYKPPKYNMGFENERYLAELDDYNWFEIRWDLLDLIPKLITVSLETLKILNSINSLYNVHCDTHHFEKPIITDKALELATDNQLTLI